ncbi:MAG: 16S rRNA (cytosine(1402)-N(4))-methyltransferase RsmH [Coprobacillus sp.]|nr:16S rRNA (cytosine(1402)-N(4))-methyltransferase RsmH [Coprobacillus sp.]
MSEALHTPVLLTEVIENLNIKEDGTYLDLTIGRAGHAREILSRLKGGTLIGVDQDEEAISYSEKRLSEISSHFILIKDNFAHVKEILSSLNIEKLDGVIMDLGVSSPMFDDPARGFSYKEDAPLDMRMDTTKELTAYKVVNEYSKEELTRIFSEYGEDRYAKRVAERIYLERKDKPIKTTGELVSIIKKAKPSSELSKKGHPARQIFQALRIEVNDELSCLSKALTDVIPYLDSGARILVISFQSLEDRIVKQTFKSLTTVVGNRVNGPMENIEPDYRLITKKPITPSEMEITNNNRARSAKLRIMERK